MKNPRPTCPNLDCVHHTAPTAAFFWKRGYYRPKHNHQPVPRYQCKTCGAWFSATQTKAIRHLHRPDLNQRVFEMAVSGTSMRRMAELLGCSHRTIARKVVHLAQEAQKHHAVFLADPKNRTAYAMMDELESFVHARYKQLSVPVVVRVKTGQILAFDVCRIPSTMTLGGAGVNPLPPGGSPWVQDDRPTLVPRVLAAIKPLLKEAATLATDGYPSYPKWIREAGLKVSHQVNRSPKETSLGRAKKRADGTPRERDSLFAINLIHAKLRNDVARLGKKTWVTTKTVAGLRNHLWLYVAWVNGYALK